MTPPTPTAAAHRHRLALTLTAAFLGWMFDGVEMAIFPMVARPALREMHGATGAIPFPGAEAFVQHWMGVVTATFLLGAAAGGLAFGWLGDRIGRVRAMTVSILAYSLFTGACYFAREPWHLAVLRFAAALGMGGEWALGVALVMESWPERLRPLLSGLIGASANVGYLLVGGLAVLSPITEHSWRWIMLVGAAPALLTFFLRLYVPESERWRASVRHHEARPLWEVLSHPLLPRTLMAILFAAIPLVVTWGIVQWIVLWADQITGGRIPTAKAYVQLALAFGAVLGSLGAPLLGLHFGRRPIYCGLCFSALAVCTGLFRGVHSYGAAFLILTFLVGGATAAFYGWLPLYLPELFPTRARATGQGLSFNFGRVLAAIGAWQMPTLMEWFDHSYPRAGATLVLIYLVGAFAIWLAPETRDRPLPA